MAAFMLPLLLLSVGAFFSPSDANENYNRLPVIFKKGVDLAMEKVNSHAGIQHHFHFFKSLLQSDVEPGFDVRYNYHHFYLKATKCAKGTVDPTGCEFRNDRPLIDCGICYKTLGEEIEPEPAPYVHCVHKTTLTQEMKESRVQHCNKMTYNSGVPSLLSSTGTD